MEQYTVVVIPQGGGAPVELTPEADSVGFTTMTYGGFGSCTFAVPLAQLRGGIRRIPKLSTVRLLHGSRLLWEGRLEDHEVDYISERVGVNCFGYQRLLDDTSVKRIWIQRAIGWQLVTDLFGTGQNFSPRTWFASAVGRFDPTNLARNGVLLSAQTNLAASAGDGHGAWYYTDAGMSKILFDEKKNGNDPIATEVYDSPNGTTWTSRHDAPVAGGTSGGTLHRNVTLGSSVKYLRLVCYFISSVTGANVAGEYENIRLLHAVTTEDLTGFGSGSFYPETLLNDIISLVAGLNKGRIDNDTSFTIAQLARTNRDKIRSVIEEITSYYVRRWGVWEDKRFDWTAVNLDEAQWVLSLSDLKACSITSSVDNVMRTVYLSYQNVGSGLPEEASAVATDQRNPWVKSGEVKDEILQAPVAMTSSSAAQLASRIRDDHGSIPAVRGRVSLRAWAQVENVAGQRMPACYIRAGENVLIPELPKDDYLRPGRDGQTLFHVTATSLDAETGLVTLELDGYSRTADVLISRISAATRVLTG